MDLLLRERLPAGSPLSPHLHFGLTRHNYHMVGRETALVDLARYRSAVMVGCGTFPATLLFLADHSPIPSIAGIDADPAAVGRARELVRHTGHRIVFQCGRGEDHDFSGCDLIFIANGAGNKRQVLARAAATAAAGADLLVRIPIGLGKLFYEELAADPPVPGLRYRGRGPRDLVFCNRILLFTRAAAQDDREVPDAP